MMVIVGAADYLTGWELHLAVLYLLPIAAVTWIAGVRGGIAFSVLATGLWVATDTFSDQAFPYAPHFRWAWLVRLGTYLLFVVVLARLKEALGKADVALHRSEGRYQTLVAALPHGVLEVDLAGHVLLSNPALQGILLASEARLRQLSVSDLFENSERTLAHLRNLLDSQSEPVHHFGRMRRPEGGLVETRVDWVCKRDESGSPGGYIAVVTDITEHKQVEEMNRRQQERLQLVSKLITVGEMASTLAHELNQPLASIVNFNMGCARRIRSGSWNESEVLDALEQGSRQAERAGHIIQGIRNMVTKREPSRVALDINGIIAEVARLIEIDAEKNGVRVRLDLASDLPRVRADKIMIEQVMLNLVKNAFEAMEHTEPPRREIRMASSRNGGEVVEFALSDRGIGIPEALSDSQFPLFFTTKRDGMGLGLSICRSIIEFHDGRLWASRNADGGSTFHFTLPLGAA